LVGSVYPERYGDAIEVVKEPDAVELREELELPS
jgi:hypothetical protein